MGAGNSNSQIQEPAAKYGGIYLKANKDRYHPGEQFQGIIYINLVMQYPGDSITLIVKGVEKFMRSYVTHRKKNVQHLLAKDRYAFLLTRIPVYRSPAGVFQPGQYAFPISFLIPLNIPSSVYQEGDQWVASVEFKVKAVMNTFDPKANKLRYKENIIIEEHRKLQNVPLEKTENVPLTMCCCFGYGNTVISLGLEKDALMPGETTSLRFKVDNSQGKLSFVSARCNLIEKVVLGVTRFYFEHNAVAVELPGFKAKETLSEQRIQLTLPGYNAFNAKFKKIPIKRVRFGDVHRMLYTPGELVPTTLGRIVSIQFFLALELVYGGCDGCFTPPTVFIPVQIYIPQFTLSMNAPVVPNNWNPTMMPTTNLTLNMGNQNSNPYGGGGIQQGGQQLISMNENFMRPQQNFNTNMYGGGNPQQAFVQKY